ncbi:MAG: transposase [Proteobacteria bacterium]|nr:transposase [Pseudomonadota bacterium]
MGKISPFAAFADERSAHRYLEEVLWPNGTVCPYCGSKRVVRLIGNSLRTGRFKCLACQSGFSATHRTLFEDTSVPLRKWLVAVYLTRGGNARVSPQHIARVAKVSPLVAAKMLRRLQQAANLAPRVSSSSRPDILAAILVSFTQALP